MRTLKTTTRRTVRKKAAAVAQPVVDNSFGIKVATLDDLRALDAETRSRIVDYVTSGVPIRTFREELERSRGLRVESDALLMEFYQEEARQRWSGKIEAASIDADSILNILRNSNMDFSEALLQALGQETFRMITQRELDCKQIEKFTRLLLQARAQDNARKNSLAMLELQRMKTEHQVRSQMEKALAALADEIGKYPDARALFDALCARLREPAAEELGKGELGKGDGRLEAGGGEDVAESPLSRGVSRSDGVCEEARGDTLTPALSLGRERVAEDVSHVEPSPQPSPKGRGRKKDGAGKESLPVEENEISFPEARIRRGSLIHPLPSQGEGVPPTPASLTSPT